MRFRDDNRAVTVQIGAVLLFATLIIALSLYQATVVPSQNADVEYKHSQTVQNQLTDVRNALLRSAATGNSQPASVSLGTQYPSRIFLMNPPPATGTLRTGSYDNGTIQVSNVEATNPETRDFLNGGWTASTKYLEYEPDYNEYGNAPNLRYESSVLSNFYPNADGETTIPLTDQLLVDNETRTITLVTLNGSLSTSRASSVTVTPETLSAPYQRVQVQANQSDDPVNVSVPTRVSASQLLDRTDLGSHPGVVDVVDVPDEDRVVVQVNWTDRFTLQTARVGVGSRTENPPPHYLTLVENRGDRVTVEARDKFNNAESGVKVNASNGSLFVDSPVWTDESGRATFEVADNESGSTTLTILDNDTAHERVGVTVDATAGGGGGGSGGGGGGGDGDSSSADRIVKVSGSDGTFWGGPGVTFDVENTGDSQVEVKRISVDSTTASQASRIYEGNGGTYAQGQHEIYIDASTDGRLETGDGNVNNYYQIGNQRTLSSAAVLDGSSTATISTYAFRDNGGGAVDMNGETVAVTLYFADDSSKTFTVNL